MLFAVLLILSLIAIGLAVLHDANTRHMNARHANRNSPPVKTRPGWGEGSQLPEGAFTIYDIES